MQDNRLHLSIQTYAPVNLFNKLVPACYASIDAVQPRVLSLHGLGPKSASSSSTARLHACASCSSTRLWLAHVTAIKTQPTM